MEINILLEKTKSGFKSLSVDQKYQKSALEFIEKWLSEEQFKEYHPQIEHLIKVKEWDYLLDSFYQIIPFGTGGRRGEVGIGPNRINKWTIQASAQGHSQYLIKEHGKKAKERGVVLSYGVREYFADKYFNQDIPNPVKNLKGSDLAQSAAEVYTANGIKVYIFDAPRTTPETSFAIRYLKAIAGDMFDASHNPPEHNGKKVFDQYGGQLIPPFDEKLVDEVTKRVKSIKTISIDEAKVKGLYHIIDKDVDERFIDEIINLSLSDNRNLKIAFTPLHGVGGTSIQICLDKTGFDVNPDPKTSNQSGRFENVTFNIPNPEVVESFDTTIKYAKEINADIIINADPDADRVGVMINHAGEWRFLNGNEIGVILLNYVISKKKSTLNGKGIVIKTSVTTDLATQICNENDVEIFGNLLVGFKYIGDIMNKIEDEGKIENFLFGLEESHGYIAGNYLRDKDGAIAALWLAELAATLKKEGKTLLDYLNGTYSKYGYFRNYLTEIRLPGAEGMSKIRNIQDFLRNNIPKKFGKFIVEKVEDFQDRKPIVSETDRLSKDVLVFHFKTDKYLSSMKVTVRPSGTEPKVKMYFEIGNQPDPTKSLESIKKRTDLVLKDLEKSFMKYCYSLINVDFPDRGFLLFWQLPLKDKLKYFEIEDEIAAIKKIKNKDKRREELDIMLEFLGSDPVEKINKAFENKYNKSIYSYLNIEDSVR